MVVRGRKRRDVGEGGVVDEEEQRGLAGADAAKEVGGDECSWTYIVLALTLGALGICNMAMFSRTMYDLEKRSHAAQTISSSSALVLRPDSPRQHKIEDDTAQTRPDRIFAAEPPKQEPLLLSFPSHKAREGQHQQQQQQQHKPAASADINQRDRNGSGAAEAVVSLPAAAKAAANNAEPVATYEVRKGSEDHTKGGESVNVPYDVVRSQVPDRVEEENHQASAETPTPKAPGVGAVRTYAAGDLPIAVIAFNRPQYLSRCLDSLLKASEVTAGMITVYQDGGDAGVEAAAKAAGIRLERHERTAGREGAQHIAAHYGWALAKVFEGVPGAAYAVILEEDMVVSLDFLVYFLRMAPAMDADETLYCVSAFNDNGLGHLAQDTGMVYRTEWFVGLGWLVKREHFVRDWLPEWPDTHWDHWLRQDSVRKGRECLYPEVPRDLHIGEHGMNMDAKHYKRYNARVRLNTDGAASLPPASTLVDAAYEASLEALLVEGRIASSLADLEAPLGPGEGGAGCASPTVVYYAAGLSDPDANGKGRMDVVSPWKPVSNFFGLWHEPKRGLHRGMHRFHYRGRCILLVDSSSGYAKRHMPAGATAFGGQHFGAATWARVSSDPHLSPLLVDAAPSHS